ncbi:hypothetical protein F5141DRAFT_141590 [Pisolithus sp. B1]|nr:hypothetical protein F5141DRAFT_141590 [Pisolithus sp. B1]
MRRGLSLLFSVFTQVCSHPLQDSLLLTVQPCDPCGDCCSDLAPLLPRSRSDANKGRTYRYTEACLQRPSGTQNETFKKGHVKEALLDVSDVAHRIILSWNPSPLS